MTDTDHTIHPQIPQGHDDSPPPAASPPRYESPWMRHRTWAREQDILTERGWREGYVVLKPSRWMVRFFFEHLLPLNSALTRLEGNTFTLLGMSEAFAHQARTLLQQLADYRVTSRKLAREAERLARGRIRQGDRARDTASTVPLDDGELAMLRAPSLAEERAAHVHDGP